MGLLKYDFKYGIDDPERTLEHKDIILRKKFLNKLYLEWYGHFMDEARSLPSGTMIELGSGGGFLKDVMPDVITSDILPLPGNDMTFSALSMPFENESLSAIFMIDTFHHIPDSEAFLREASRTLMPGGIIMMIEPAAGAWGKCIYRNLHHEPFEPTAGWTIPPSGPMSGANGALPWIVFERDRLKFNTLFPEFEIKSIDYHTPLRYLISGGVSFRCPVPSFLFGAVSSLEKAIHGNRFSMFMTVTVRKKQLAL